MGMVLIENNCIASPCSSYQKVNLNKLSQLYVGLNYKIEFDTKNSATFHLTIGKRMNHLLFPPIL